MRQSVHSSGLNQQRLALLAILALLALLALLLYLRLLGFLCLFQLVCNQVSEGLDRDLGKPADVSDVRGEVGAGPVRALELGPVQPRWALELVGHPCIESES